MLVIYYFFYTVLVNNTVKLSLGTSIPREPGSRMIQSFASEPALDECLPGSEHFLGRVHTAL